MFIKSSIKTSWFHLFLIISAALIALYVIIDAWQKPFVSWQNYNEIQVQQLKIINE